MTPTDLRILCAALGFTAVAMQAENTPEKESALRAAVLAGLIEEFCRTTLPDAFDEAGKDVHKRHLDLIREMAVAIELCLECEGRLTWSAEHDAQVILAKAGKILS